MNLKKKEKMVVDAFINCIKHNIFEVYYADVLIADQSKYGWLSEAALEYYETLTEPFREQENTEEVPEQEE